MKRFLGSILCAMLFATACTSAHADRPAPPPPPPPHDQALAIAPAAVRAAYNVKVEDEDGTELSMYAKNGRYYVLGNSGDRYVIHVSNPTAQRVEAVISVDGLDVVDGDAGDLRKRGYVIAPYGDLSIEGFRTSTTDVATFRFSAVGDSYAERKGKGRNVGVIAVAIFEEKAQPQIVQPLEPEPEYDYRRDLQDEDGAADRAKEPAPPPTSTPATNGAAPRGAIGGAAGSSATHSGQAAPAAPAKAGAARTASKDDGDEGNDYVAPPAQTEAKRERPGLGTEFGESRYSSVTFTKFERASSKPAAVAELRYNDASGLEALGIPVQPMPDSDELGTRESANPFPGDQHFAHPPAGVR